MATLNEIAYNIQNLAHAGSSTTGEESLGIRQIKYWVHYHRAQILREMAKGGKGFPYSCLQSVDFTQKQDIYATNAVVGEEWKSYLDTNTESFRELIVWSERSITDSTVNSIEYSLRDFYGRDFYDWHTYEVKEDYGFIRLACPELLDIDGYGIKSLRIKRNQTINDQNNGTIDVGLVSKDEFQNRGHNRFSKGKPSAALTKWHDGNTVLEIGPLKSHLRNRSTGYGDPIQYRVYTQALLSNPELAEGWHDDLEYPFPDEMLDTLTKRIMSNEVSAVMQTREDEVDDNREAKVQQEVQGQVRRR